LKTKYEFNIHTFDFSTSHSLRQHKLLVIDKSIAVLIRQTITDREVQ